MKVFINFFFHLWWELLYLKWLVVGISFNAFDLKFSLLAYVHILITTKFTYHIKPHDVTYTNHRHFIVVLVLFIEWIRNDISLFIICKLRIILIPAGLSFLFLSVLRVMTQICHSDRPTIHHTVNGNSIWN